VPAAGIIGAYPLEVRGQTILVDSPLVGDHQHRNLALAIAAAQSLAERPEFASITARAIETGVRKTRWPGRLERLESGGRQWILDVAHNPAGAWALRSGLRIIMRDNQAGTLVFSCLRDKPMRELAQILFPLFQRVILAPIHSARAAGEEELLRAAEAAGTEAVAAHSVGEALRLAAEAAGSDPIVVSGSVYLVGEARSLILSGALESR
jgi:dihydrofolate synthase/folylpolyglutamate synthase